MTKPFSDQIASITGGSDGIKPATTFLLAQQAAHVSICARRAEKLEDTELLIEEAGESGQVQTAAHIYFTGKAPEIAVKSEATVHTETHHYDLYHTSI